ncbi:hypothetical protein E0L93_10555 [Rubrobacter taiwanensis]|jgi:hypothetical protein|uniref:Uncharacterized protein n=1 Tax=Rubrobacter taiwanensis TaxID=185139 RepID=A0A4V2NW68_9ACTN|nr:hypothetical protein [Rubrobacter taiwanensis]TCJ16112.1 hypothetical protein E0L93_10555 [Rubrobacter taiwanensis]
MSRSSERPRSGTLLLSHLLRALLFGAAAGWGAGTLAGYVAGWPLYAACFLLAGTGGWVLTRPMAGHTVLAALVLWAVAGGVYLTLRPVAPAGLLGAGEVLGGYLSLLGVLAAFGLGAFAGRAVARP